VTGADDQRWTFFFGAVLVGLGCAGALYAVLAPVPPLPTPPTWARLFYLGLPTYLAFVERHRAIRVGWVLVAVWAATSWAMGEERGGTYAVMTGAALQSLAGLAFVRASISDLPRAGRLLGVITAAAVAAARMGLTYWWAQTLSQYAQHG
jgi:hypothetical protein